MGRNPVGEERQRVTWKAIRHVTNKRGKFKGTGPSVYTLVADDSSGEYGTLGKDTNAPVDKYSLPCWRNVGSSKIALE